MANILKAHPPSKKEGVQILPDNPYAQRTLERTHSPFFFRKER